MEIRLAGSAVNPDLNRLIAEFVSQQLWGASGKFDKFSSFGVFDDSRLIAGMLWHNWQPQSGVIEISGAATDRRWLTRDALRTLFDVPFARFGCQLVVFRVSPLNAHMVEIATRFGFSPYRIQRLRGRAEDEIIFTLTDDQWRRHPLLKERHAGIDRRTAA